MKLSRREPARGQRLTGWLTWFSGKLHLLGRFVFCGVVVPALLASPGDGRGCDERARRVRRVSALIGQVAVGQQIRTYHGEDYQPLRRSRASWAASDSDVAG
jgi:hypothetical protein